MNFGTFSQDRMYSYYLHDGDIDQLGYYKSLALSIVNVYVTVMIYNSLFWKQWYISSTEPSFYEFFVRGIYA